MSAFRQGEGLHACYVLHRRPYRETSLLLEIFSREEGRLGIVARGARRPRSRHRLVLQPFQPLLANWRGRGELQVLSHAEPHQGIVSLEGESYLAGFYLNELLLRLLHRYEAHLELFAAYEKAIFGLQAGADRYCLLRVFEMNLLRALGYGLQLDHDTFSGERVRENRQYYYQEGSGPSVRLPRGEGALRVSGRALLALAAGAVERTESVRREGKRLLRYHLDLHLRRPLNSRALYREYVRLGNVRSANDGA